MWNLKHTIKTKQKQKYTHRHKEQTLRKILHMFRCILCQHSYLTEEPVLSRSGQSFGGRKA